MFEDILGKDKRYVETVKWVLSINEEEYEVEVFNAVKNDRGYLEGYIKDSNHVIDRYTNYTIKMPEMPNYSIIVMLLRVNKDTIKFYIPEAK